MSASYRLFGAESSAYSTKMRAFMRYKGVEFDWVPRTANSEEELAKVSRFSTLPVLVTASGFAVHDTTPMIEALEADTPEPSALPDDAALSFLAYVLEEYADTWLAKAAFQFRWTRKKDQKEAAKRAISEYFGENEPDDRKAMEASTIERMTEQLPSVGLEGDLGPAVEKSFKKFVKLLNEHLRRHLFIFGGRPSIADFAIGGQLIQMQRDPTAGKIIEKDGEFVAKWCEFLVDAKPGGPFESLEDLQETLIPIFKSDLSKFFLPWAAENLENSLAGNETFEVTLGKDKFTLRPLRSAARSFRDLRKRFVKAQEIEALKALTDAGEATEFLQRPASVRQRDSEEGDGEGEGGGRRRRRRRRGRTRASEGDAQATDEASAADLSGDEGSAGDKSDAEAADTGADDES